MLPEISVIVPVYNGAATLADCLRSIYKSSFSAYEVILINDASTDGSADVAASFPCQFLELDSNSGPAKARNLGALKSSGRILFFLDADILIQKDTLQQIIEAFGGNPSVSALFGSYTKETVPTDLVSRYKNLLHHYTHQTSNPEAVTFCGGFGAIRRNVFEEMKGFDPSWRFLEDIEFGHRLHRGGHRILLLKSLQFTHCKRYTLTSLIKSDLLGRAVPWSRLMLENQVIKSDLNLKPHNILSVPVAYLIPITLVIPGAQPLALLLTAVFVWLNYNFLALARNEYGLGFAFGSAALSWLGYLYSGLGVLLGSAQYLWTRCEAFFGLRASPKT
jgi:glycosyltransferase involved in cell wall biosynthesis